MLYGEVTKQASRLNPQGKRTEKKEQNMKKELDAAILDAFGLADKSQNPVVRFGNICLSLALWIKTLKPVLTILVMVVLSATGVFAQGNPFPTRGDQSFGNLVQGILTVLAWVAAAIGIGSFAAIAICLFFKMEYKTYIYSGAIGLGGWAIMGSLAYLLVNNESPDLPELGR